MKQTNAERLQAQRRRKAAAEGRTIREWKRRSPEEARSRKAAQKRAARRAAAEIEGRQFDPKPRRASRMDAHVRAWSEWQRLTRVLHDAHVRRYRAVVQARATWHQTKHTEWVVGGRKLRRRSERVELHDRYIVRLLTDGNRTMLPDLPCELIEAKREQVRLQRLINEMRRNTP